MVNFRDPAIVAQNKWTRTMLWHSFVGIYLWEFFTTLDYEWKVIRGRIPYRWTIWVYSFTRVFALMSAIACILIMDVTIPIDCQLLLSLGLVACYVPVVGASLLIVLRVIAIWNRNKAVMVTTIIFWVINTAFLIHGTAQLRSEWVGYDQACKIFNPGGNGLTIISIAITDIALLFIMLVGLFRLRRCGGGLGLTSILWKQGLISMSLAAIAEVPPAVLVILNLNDQLNMMLQFPALITMTIAATRMHRSLVDYAFKSSDIGQDNHQASGLVFAKDKRTIAMSIPPRTEVSVDIAHHPGRHSPSINTSDDVHVKLDTLFLDENGEGDV